jgi:DNA-binding transcriptional LysR family regulator
MQWDERIGRRIKLRDLHILLAVVQTGSMSRAAARLAVSHPVVSKTIADLERILSVRLLDRTPQGVEPTAYGRALLNCGTTVFDELRRGVQEIAFLSDPTVGELRVGSGAPYIDGLIPAVIARLDQRYPRIRFRVTETDAVTLCGMLRDRKLDLVIGRVLPAVFGEDLTSEVLFDEHMRVVAGLDSPWSRRRKVLLRDLVTERWLMPESDNIAMALISEAFRSAGLEAPAPHVVSNSMTFRIRLIETGRFLAVLPESTLMFAGRRLHTKILPIALKMTSPPTVAIALKNRTPNPVSKLFADEIRAAVKEVRRQRPPPRDATAIP